MGWSEAESEEWRGRRKEGRGGGREGGRSYCPSVRRVSTVETAVFALDFSSCKRGGGEGGREGGREGQ